MEPLPIAVITGFLGSGKTTLLNCLLRNDSLKNSLVIINEFGEIGIDHLLVSTPVENIRLLSNGCLCCEVRGDLVNTLTEAIRQRASAEIPDFDRILIETTGIADPVPIVQTIVTDRDLSPLLKLDAVVTMIDVVHAFDELQNHEEMRKQIVVSDVLLLSKIDLVDSAVVEKVKREVRKINSGAELIYVSNGEVSPDLLFGRSIGKAREADIERWLRQESHGEAVTDGEITYALHSEDIQTFSISREGAVSRSGLITWLSMLANFKGRQLLRVKGLINIDGDPYVIHVVQTVIHDPVKLDYWPSEDRESRIVFITCGLARQDVEAMLAAFSIPEKLGGTKKIDASTYARFAEAAKQFVQ